MLQTRQLRPPPPTAQEHAILVLVLGAVGFSALAAGAAWWLARRLAESPPPLGQRPSGEPDPLAAAGAMMSALVHDFRNPLGTIKGYASLLAQHDLDPERRLGYVRLLTEEADRMNRMIEEMLEFTRGERRPLELGIVDLQELTERTFRLLWPQLESRGIEYRSQLDYSGPLAVDVNQMRRAMLNIGSNAIEAMPQGGRFTVSSRLMDGMVELSLADTGCGIPEELQPRVFEPFFTHGKPRGIGLGMAIARRIVEEHGGRIALESRPGEGTRFTLSLPVRLPG